MADTTTRWYAVRYRQPANRGRTTCTHRNGARRFVIEVLLQERGLEVFLPVRKVWRQKSRHAPAKRLVSYPLLTGWVFAGWPCCEDRWSDLFSVDMVCGVAGSGGVPRALPQAAVDALRRRWSGPDAIAPERERFMRTHREFDIGDRVEIARGPFAGQRVKVVDLRGPKARVLLDLLGGARAVEMETYHLEVA